MLSVRPKALQLLFGGHIRIHLPAEHMQKISLPLFPDLAFPDFCQAVFTSTGCKKGFRDHRSGAGCRVQDAGWFRPVMVYAHSICIGWACLGPTMVCSAPPNPPKYLDTTMAMVGWHRTKGGGQTGSRVGRDVHYSANKAC